MSDKRPTGLFIRAECFDSKTGKRGVSFILDGLEFEVKTRAFHEGKRIDGDGAIVLSRTTARLLRKQGMPVAVEDPKDDELVRSRLKSTTLRFIEDEG